MLSILLIIDDFWETNQIIFSIIKCNPQNLTVVMDVMAKYHIMNIRYRKYYMVHEGVPNKLS